MYTIQFSVGALEDLLAVRPFEQARVLEAIGAQLGHLPTSETRNRKQLWGLVPPFEAVLRIWELRVGEHRIFSDVEEEENRVYVRAIRRKPPHKRTEEIL